MATTSLPSYFLVLIALFASLVLLAKTNDLDMFTKSHDDNDKNNNVNTESNLVFAYLTNNVMFEQWIKKHKKGYSSVDEMEFRSAIFNSNWRYIIRQNELPNRKYKLGLNRFADLTHDEYQKLYLRPPRSNQLERVSTSNRYQPNENDNLPASKDWRAEGAVGDIKDQGTCRCSPVFSAVASVEAINKIVMGGDLISLSEQELVDCGDHYTRGCDNVFNANNAFSFIVNNGGIHTDDSYPYIGSNGECATEKKNGINVTIDKYESVPVEDEHALKKVVARQPVSTWINARDRDFQLYESGIFHGTCSEEIDHYVNVVGYGSNNDDDTKYWIIRNSWGKGWGEKGYLRLERDVGCKYGPNSITAYPSYPVKNNPSPSPIPSPSPSPSPSQCLIEQSSSSQHSCSTDPDSGQDQTSTCLVPSSFAGEGTS